MRLKVLRILLFFLAAAFGLQAEEPLFYVIKEIDANKRIVVLEDESQWQIGWWYSNITNKWKPGDRLKIIYHLEVDHTRYNYIELQNLDNPSIAWGAIWMVPSRTKRYFIQTIESDQQVGSIILLNTGLIFVKGDDYYTQGKVGDQIFLTQNNNDTYGLWNLTQSHLSSGWRYQKASPVSPPPPSPDVPQLAAAAQPVPSAPKDKVATVSWDSAFVLGLEEKLNQRIIDQPEATKAVAHAITNHCAGLKDPKTPIRTFLFLGPTGVGKTELSKVLNDELYHNLRHFIRFDMSHFSEPHSGSRLIGSPPGYVDHDKGGALTEPLKSSPQAIVLLDEIEKADPAVRKIFLPVFDEGFITDTHSTTVQCNEVVFIMTSNLCAKEIIELFAQGCSPEEILRRIEPILIHALTPELYARIEPVVFRPLTHGAMVRMIDMMLKEVSQRIKLARQIDLTMDQSVKDYLLQNGLHPTLGARPLKALIHNKVISNVSHALLKQNIPNNSHVTLFYLNSGEWVVEWKPNPNL